MGYGALVTVILLLGQHGGTSLPSITDSPDSGTPIRYVCFDSGGTIKAVITQEGQDARLASCPVGLSAMATDDGAIGDTVEDGKITTQQ